MEKVNLWNSNLSSKYIFFNSVEEYFNYCIENNISMDFILKNSFNPNSDNPNSLLDTKAQSLNIHLTYTSDDHPISISNNMFYSSYISPSFFEKNKDQFIKCAFELFKRDINNKNKRISIPDFIFNDTILNTIINNDYLKTISYRLESISNIELSIEQLQNIKDNFLEFDVSNSEGYEKISTRRVIDNYTIEELKTIDKLYISLPLSDSQLVALKFVNPNCLIKIKSLNIYDEKEYAKSLTEMVNRLGELNNNYNVEINIKNRALFNDFFSKLPKNINLLIKNDYIDYDLETYMKEEGKLDFLISEIKNSNLSMYEKYLAVYDIVKNFKPYNESPNEPNESRKIKYILDNEYMVCVGYAKLLTTLLDKVGIPCKEIGAGVDVSYDDGFTKEDKNISLSGHARTLVSINDDKYGIHGIYVSDPTWDNMSDLYFNSTMTFDRKKEARRLESLSDVDLLFDFHDKNEFFDKIVFYCKYNFGKFKSNKGKEMTTKDLLDSYSDIYIKLCESLEKLDPKEFENLFYKYKDRIKNYSLDRNDLKIEAINEMLDEYSKYIIPRVNNLVSLETIIQASINYKLNLGLITKEESHLLYEELLEQHKKKETKVFPYNYDYEKGIEAYLEPKSM